MPKLNPNRTTTAEENLARRIAYERQKNNMKQATLARRMTDHGCPMSGSTVFKIESGEPLRRVSVDELVAFSRVFGLDPTDLLMPLGVVFDRSAAQTIREVNKVLRSVADGVRDLVVTKEKAFRTQRKLVGRPEQPIGERIAEWWPSLMISYPMGDEDDPATPDPVWDAWQALDAATWRVAEYRAEALSEELPPELAE